MEIKVNSGNISKCDITWKAKRFIRVTHSIMFLLSGESHYVSDDEDVTLIPGHIYITPINKIYEVTQNPKKIMEHLWFNIDGIYNLPNKLIDIDTNTDTVMKSIILSIMEMMRCKIKVSIIEKQLGIMFSLLPVHLYEPMDIRMKTIMEFISKHFGEKISNVIIAKHMNLDADYLGRLFRDKMGITLHKYIEKLRIEKACLLILEDESIEVVSQKVGYEDTKSFSRAFKKSKGTSITKYKETQKKSVYATIITVK